MSKRNRKHQASYQQPLSKPTTSVDVVIPVYGEFDFLKTCLEGLPQALGDISYKLIIVDNASPDQKVATDFFRDLKYPINITVRRLQKNVGYPGAMNVGSKYGISPYILIHTPDVWYRPDAIKILLETMKSDPTYGIVCPKLLFPENCPHGPAGKIQHAGLDMDIHAEVVHTFIGWSPDHPKVNIRGEVFAATGASFLTRRSLWQQIGGFNTVYGKGCLVGDTQVLTSKGIKRLDSFHSKNIHTPISETVASINIPRETTLAYRNGKEKIRKIVVTNGFELSGTLNHKIIIMNKNGNEEWRELGKLSIGDYVAIKYGDNLFGEIAISDDFAYFIGLYISEGNCEMKSDEVGRICITNGDKEIQNKLQKMGFYPNGKYHWRKGNIQLIKEMKSLGIDFSQKSYEKELSSQLLSLSEQSMKSLLQGMFDGDGCAIKDGRVTYASSSLVLIKQVQLILLNFGIVSSISMKKVGHSRFSKRVSYTLDLGSGSKDFYTVIGFRLTRKQERKDRVRPQLSFSIPYQRTWYKKLYQRFSKKKYKYFGHIAFNSYHGVRRANILNLLLCTKDLSLWDEHKHLREVLFQKIYWAQIKTIEDLNESVETFDLHVPDGHSYVANGFIVHNTYEDVEFAIMCKARGFKVIYEPDAVATHYVGASKDQYALSENSQIFKMRNNQFFIWTDWRRL